MSGDIRVQDLDRLFYNMRAESGFRGLVNEVVNFLAHPDIRNQGIVTEELRKLFPIIKLHLHVTASPLIHRSLPAWVPNALRANLERMRTSTLKRETGTNRKRAKKVLERILARMMPAGPGAVHKPTFSNEEERAIFECVARHIKGGPIFDEDELFDDFSRLLQKKNALEASEVSTLKKVQPAISLFTLTLMHNQLIDLGDGSTATLAIGRDIYGNLGIFGRAEVFPATAEDEPYFAQGWVFQTNLPIADYCEEGVPPPDRTPFVGDFEMTPEMKLARL